MVSKPVSKATPVAGMAASRSRRLALQTPVLFGGSLFSVP